MKFMLLIYNDPFVVHLFVVLYEEPTLKGSFGVAYSDYRARVKRWIPGTGFSRRLPALTEHYRPPADRCLLMATGARDRTGDGGRQVAGGAIAPSRRCRRWLAAG